MGEVYRARATRLGRTVAIKVLPPQLAADPQFRERFEREARTVSQLTHPNICTLYDVGETGDGPAGAATHFLVMEHLEVETLSRAWREDASPFRTRCASRWRSRVRSITPIATGSSNAT